MSLKTILIIIIGLVVVGAGTGLWYISRLQSPSQSSTQTGQNGLPNTPGVSGEADTQTQPQAPASSLSDVEQAYSVLFQKLSAQKIVFATVSASTTGNAASIYALYASDIAESKKDYPSATNFSIEVAAADLNNDGTSEALVYEDLPGFCGTGGCNIDIYQLQKSKWVKISNMLAGGDMGLSSTSTNGYSDLFLSVSGGIGSQSNVVRYTWYGTQYQPGPTVATWDGATFNLTQ